MTLLQKIQNLTWWALDIKLKDILSNFLNRVEVLEQTNGGLEEAPVDGNAYARKDSGWVEVSETSGGVNTGDQDLSGKADINSPAFTGTPTAPTATAGTNTTQIATTAFVLANAGGGGSSTPQIEEYDSLDYVPEVGVAGQFYLTKDDNKLYRYDDGIATEMPPSYVLVSGSEVPPTPSIPSLSQVTAVGATTNDVVTVGGAKIPSFAFVNSVSSLYSQMPNDSFSPGTGVFDNLNNLYLVNYLNNIVIKTTPSGVTTTYANVGTNPKSIVIDSGQNIFTLNEGSVNVSKITPTGVVTVFATVSGYNMTIDSSDNLYVTFSNGVYKVTSNGVVSLFYSGTISNTQLSIDNLDNIYVKSNTGIVQILPNGSSNLFYSSTYSSLTFQASKTTGYVYIKDNTATYKKLNTATTPTQITNFPQSINFIDHQTDILYYGEFESNSTANVVSFNPNTGITTNYLFNQNEGIFNRFAFSGGDFYAINSSKIYKVSFTSTKLLTSDNQGLLVKSNDLLLKNGVLSLPNSSIATILNAKDVVTKEYADANYSGGGSGATNLTTTQSPTTVTVNSDTGTDATIVLANGTNSGVSSNDYSNAEKSKLAGIASGATANSSDATLLARVNHTGTQTASTISDFNASVDSRIASSNPDLSFLNVTYSSTISRAYNELRPNLEIDITGNLDFTLTGTSNGESGMLNLYFSGTQVATLNGVTDLVVTGAGAMIPVYFVHDSDGLKWYKYEVGGATVDTSLFALADGTILYHTLPMPNITSTITTVGTDVTISAGQFSNERSVGNKIKINGESRIVTVWLDWNHVTVDSAFTTNYTNEPKLNWDFYSKSLALDNTGSIVSYAPNGFTTSKNDGSSGRFSVEEIVSPQNTYSLGQEGLKFRADRVIRHSNGASAGDASDIGLRRNSAGIYEVYDGNNPDGLEANRRDLLVRNLTAKTVTVGNNTNTPSAGNEGSFRYVKTANSSNVEMVMQTGTTTYEWVNILSNTW